MVPGGLESVAGGLNVTSGNEPYHLADGAPTLPGSQHLHNIYKLYFYSFGYFRTH